jgi:hypothetical protein
MVTGIALSVITVILIGAALILPRILTQGPMPEALSAMDSSASVTVVDGRPITFTPAERTDTGLIIYPGAFVEPRSYAPAAHAIAETGTFVAIVPMPLGVAVLGGDRADDVIADHPEVTAWVIAGHSLGGVTAARYAAEHSDVVDGLALWASYPEDSIDLSPWPGTTASIFATLDGLTTVQDIEESRVLLPPDTAFVEIEGGNHAYFGWYGEQSGDNPATITREAQQRIVVEGTLAVVGAVEGSPENNPAGKS